MLTLLQHFVSLEDTFLFLSTNDSHGQANMSQLDSSKDTGRQLFLWSNLCEIFREDSLEHQTEPWHQRQEQPWPFLLLRSPPLRCMLSCFAWNKKSYSLRIQKMHLWCIIQYNLNLPLDGVGVIENKIRILTQRKIQNCIVSISISDRFIHTFSFMQSSSFIPSFFFHLIKKKESYKVFMVKKETLDPQWAESCVFLLKVVKPIFVQWCDISSWHHYLHKIPRISFLNIE